MSVATARERIEERYSESIPSVQVQLSVEPGRGNTANLVAGVDNPGSYPLEDRDVTLAHAAVPGWRRLSNLNNPQVRLFRGNAVYGIALDRLYDDPGLDTHAGRRRRVIVEED